MGFSILQTPSFWRIIINLEKTNIHLFLFFRFSVVQKYYNQVVSFSHDMRQMPIYHLSRIIYIPLLNYSLNIFN
jgi:hypothetical protein